MRTLGPWISHIYWNWVILMICICAVSISWLLLSLVTGTFNHGRVNSLTPRGCGRSMPWSDKKLMLRTGECQFIPRVCTSVQSWKEGNNTTGKYCWETFIRNGWPHRKVDIRLHVVKFDVISREKVIDKVINLCDQYKIKGKGENCEDWICKCN